MFLLLKTNHIHRIHTHTILHNLKMQVVAGAVTGTAYITYNLPCQIPAVTASPAVTAVCVMWAYRVDSPAPLSSNT